MFKKSILALALCSTASIACAEFVAGVGLTDYSEEGLDITLLNGYLGYEFALGEHFSLIPQVRLGTGIGDDTISVFQANDVKVSVDSVYGFGVRGQYQFDQGFYVFFEPSYLEMKVTVKGYGESESDSADETGYGVGAGYMFNESAGVELGVEDFDGSDFVNLGLRFKF